MKATVPPPLFGYNSSVQRGGRTFHVQTEDSGLGHPHVITHVFAEGGRIIATHRTSYADRIGDPECAVFVRRLLITQHREAFIALHDGRYDEGMQPPPLDYALDGFELCQTVTPTDDAAVPLAANGRMLALEPRDEPLALIVGFERTEETLADVMLREG